MVQSNPGFVNFSLSRNFVDITGVRLYLSLYYGGNLKSLQFFFGEINCFIVFNLQYQLLIFSAKAASSQNFRTKNCFDFGICIIEISIPNEFFE